MTSPAVYQERYEKAERKRQEAAKGLLEYHLSGIRRWRFAHRKSDNHPFFIIDGTETIDRKTGARHTPVYYTDLHECTCDSHTKGRVACKHILAVRLWFDGYKRGDIQAPRCASKADNDILEAASAIAESLDVANAADALLEKYEADQAKRRAAARPAVDWWETDTGGIVWLQEGDTITPDTVPTSVPPAVLEDLERRAAEGDGDAEHGLAEALHINQSVSDNSLVEPSAAPKPVGLVLRYEDLFGRDE